MESIIVEFENRATGEKHDLEIPTHIKVGELLYALNEVYHLNIDFRRPEQVFLLAENPTALLEKDHFISEYGLRNGAKLYYAQ